MAAAPPLALAMSTKADLLTFIQRYSGLALDAPTLDHDLDEAILHLDGTEFLVSVTLQEHDANNSTYLIPENGIRILGVWYDERQLAPASANDLDATGLRWRDRVGTPSVYTADTEGDRIVRLVPQPDAASKDFSFVHGLPYGEDFPEYAVAIACTEYRSTLPDWLDLPLTMATLAKHYAREERYRDPTFAAAVRRLADLLLTMVA